MQLLKRSNKKPEYTILLIQNTEMGQNIPQTEEEVRKGLADITSFGNSSFLNGTERNESFWHIWQLPPGMMASRTLQNQNSWSLPNISVHYHCEICIISLWEEMRSFRRIPVVPLRNNWLPQEEKFYAFQSIHFNMPGTRLFGSTEVKKLSKSDYPFFELVSLDHSFEGGIHIYWSILDSVRKWSQRIGRGYTSKKYNKCKWAFWTRHPARRQF